MEAPPRPRLGDHLRVVWLLARTVLGVLPLLGWFAFSPVLQPVVRARLRRRLARAAARPGDPPVPDARRWEGRTVFVVAGEASGDQMAARVVRALKARCPGLHVRGYAGPETAAAGADLDVDLVDRAVMGWVAVARSLGFWWRLCAETLARLREDPPDLFLTVDFPGLNVRLARWARARGVPTVHLVAPAVWAYMPWRVLRWRRAVDRLLATFSFEAALLEASGVPATFVGHPLFELPLPPPRTTLPWPGKTACSVLLLPGSRRQEIVNHAPVLLEAAAHVERALPHARFHVHLAHASHAEVFTAAGTRARQRPAHIDVVTAPEERPNGPPLLGALASSGTVTAELAAACVPMAVLYRVAPWTRLGAWMALTTPYIALANLIAGARVVPERLQVGARGARLAADFLGVVADPGRWGEVRRVLEVRVRDRIGLPDVADRAARAALQAADGDSARKAAPVGEAGSSSRPAGGPS